MLNTSPTHEVVLTGDDVDLYKLPIPMSSIYDGGPMITAGVVLARDPELGINSGIYRFIVKERNLTGIDIVTPNNMRKFAERALAKKKPLPVSISIGTHPFELVASTFKANLGVNELTFAGGYNGSLATIGYGMRKINDAYISRGGVGVDGGDFVQMRLSYNSGPLGIAIAAEHTDEDAGLVVAESG